MEHEQEKPEVVETEQKQPEPPEQAEKTWEQEREELAQRAADLEARLHQERVSTAFYRKAIAAGVSDPDRLAGIVNLSGVTFDAEGNAQGIDEILAAVTAVAPKQQPKPIGGRWGGDPDMDPTKEQMLSAAAQKATKTGRSEDIAAYTALKHRLNK